MGCLLTILGPLICLVSVGHALFGLLSESSGASIPLDIFGVVVGIIIICAGTNSFAEEAKEKEAKKRESREIRISEKIKSLTVNLHALDFDSIFQYERDRILDSPRLREIFTLAHAIKDRDYNTAVSIIENNHEFDDLLMYVGHKYRQSNNYATAKKWYSAAYKCTQDQSALLHLGICYLFLEKYEQAQTYLTQSIQKNPTPLAWYNLLVVQAKLSDTDTFLNIYRRAMQDHKFVQYMKKDKKTKIVASISLDNIQGGKK